MIPTRWLVGLAFVPVLLAAAAIALPQALAATVAVDLVLVLVAGLDLLFTSGQLQAQREVAAVQAVGREFEVSLSLRNTGSRGLWLLFSDDTPGQLISGLPHQQWLAAGATLTHSYRARVDQRGPHGFGPVSVRWRSPLGLWQRQRRLQLDTPPLRVYPDFAQLRDWQLRSKLFERQVPVRARRRPGGETEFERLRPYVAGDPYRHVDWKATARRRELISREYGQEANQNLIFLLDCGRMMSATTDGLAAFDHALNAALMMGQVALRHGDRVGLLAFDHKVRVWLPPQAGARSGARLIRGTYDLFPSLHEPDYALAFRHLSQRVRRRSLVVLITAVVDEVNADLASTLIGGLARRHLALTVWLRDTELSRLIEAPLSGPEAPWRRGAAAELVGWRERSLAAIRRRGALVVDAPPSQLTPALLSRYLEIKARQQL